MNEFQASGVQEISFQSGNKGAGSGNSNSAWRSIESITDNRVFDGAEMNPNLMGASGFDDDAKETEGGPSPGHTILCQSISGAMTASTHFDAAQAVTADGGIYRS